MRARRKQFFKYVLRNPVTQFLIACLGYVYIRFVWVTSRFDVPYTHHKPLIENPNARIIIAFWHGHMAMLPCAWAWSRPFSMLLSQHRDGMLISRVLKFFGVKSIFGSTTRGGVQASRHILTALSKGNVIGITPDGPKGPCHVCKPGIIQLAYLAAQNCEHDQEGCWIIPVGYVMSRCRILKSWDRFIFPLPFSYGHIMTRDPILIRADMTPEDLEKQRIKLEAQLNRELLLFSESK